MKFIFPWPTTSLEKDSITRVFLKMLRKCFLKSSLFNIVFKSSLFNISRLFYSVVFSHQVSCTHQASCTCQNQSPEEVFSEKTFLKCFTKFFSNRKQAWKNFIVVVAILFCILSRNETAKPCNVCK